MPSEISFPGVQALRFHHPRFWLVTMCVGMGHGAWGRARRGFLSGCEAWVWRLCEERFARRKGVFYIKHALALDGYGEFAIELI